MLFPNREAGLGMTSTAGSGLHTLRTVLGLVRKHELLYWCRHGVIRAPEKAVLRAMWAGDTIAEASYSISALDAVALR